MTVTGSRLASKAPGRCVVRRIACLSRATVADEVAACRSSRSRHQPCVGVGSPRPTPLVADPARAGGRSVRMAGIERKSFDSPDETRPFRGNGKADVVVIGGRTIGRGEFE